MRYHKHYTKSYQHQMLHLKGNCEMPHIGCSKVGKELLLRSEPDPTVSLTETVCLTSFQFSCKVCLWRDIVVKLKKALACTTASWVLLSGRSPAGKEESTCKMSPGSKGESSNKASPSTYLTSTEKDAGSAEFESTQYISFPVLLAS